MDTTTAYPPEQLGLLPLHDYYVRSNVLLFEQDGWLLPGRFHSTAEEMDLIEHGRNVLVDFSDHGLFAWMEKMQSNFSTEYRQMILGILFQEIRSRLF